MEENETMKLIKIKYVCGKCLKYHPEMSECRLEYDVAKKFEEGQPAIFCPFDPDLTPQWERAEDQ